MLRAHQVVVAALLLTPSTMALAQGNISVVTTGRAQFRPVNGTFTCPITAGETIPPFTIYSLVTLGEDRVRVKRFLTGKEGFFCLTNVAIVAESDMDAMTRLGNLERAKLPAVTAARLAARRLRVGDPASYVALACGSSADTTEEETANGVTSVTECSDQTVVVKAGRVSRIVRKKQDWEK